MFVSSRTNLHTCTLPLTGSRSPLVKYARGSHIGFSSASQTRSCALRMPRYVTFTLSLVVSDLKTRRLAGLKKEKFEELLRTSGIPCQYFCRRSFATWDVLLPTEEQAAKTAATNITTKFFRLQPEYMGTRRIRVTISNVPAFITSEVLASFLSAYGRVEEVSLLKFRWYRLRGLCVLDLPKQGRVRSHP